MRRLGVPAATTSEQQNWESAMSYESILLDVWDGVGTITLNRPERMNAWTDRMAEELSDALVSCSQRDEVRALTHLGPRAAGIGT